MSGPAALTKIENIIDGSGAAPAIEALLPAGVRHRQLTARTLLTGMLRMPGSASRAVQGNPSCVARGSYRCAARSNSD